MENVKPNRGDIMKHLIIMLSLILTVALAKDNTAVLKIDGMACSYSCAGKVSTVVTNMKGVKDCSVDFDKGIATVKYDDKKVDSSDIVDGLVKKTSYKVSILDEKTTVKKEDKS